jgi:hypothetical protein
MVHARMRQTREMSPQLGGSNDPQAPEQHTQNSDPNLPRRTRLRCRRIPERPFLLSFPQSDLSSNRKLSRTTTQEPPFRRHLLAAATSGRLPATERSLPESPNLRDEVPIEAFSEDHVNYENLYLHPCTELCSDFEHSLAREPLRGYRCRFALSPHFDNLSQL